jgi:hypothetical protein
MAVLSKIGRLFQVKTRFEAWLVIYAIALGAVERGRHYLETYSGWGGWLLALACTGVVFVAGGKLLDSVKAPQPELATGPYRPPSQRRSILVRDRRTHIADRRRAERRVSSHRD